ncbi:MAG: DUF4271 domain-containing protein [Bacteroidota bacterium]|nr:DUF4271 domain-containing protein [Bacteroidota bacterium]
MMPDFLMVLLPGMPINEIDSIQQSASLQKAVPHKAVSGAYVKDSLMHHRIHVLSQSMTYDVCSYRPDDPFLPRPKLTEFTTVNEKPESALPTTSFPVCVNPSELQGAYYFKPPWEIKQLFTDQTIVSKFWYMCQEAKPGRAYKPAKPIENWQSDWTIGILLLAFALLASVKSFFGKYLNQLLSATINSTTAARLLRESNYNLSHGAYRLDLVFYVTFTFLIFLITRYMNMIFPVSGFILFLIFLGIVLAYFLIKNLIYRMLGIVTLTQNETNEYLFNAKVYNKVLGIILFPIVLIGSYYSNKIPGLMITGGILITLLFYTMSLIRGSLLMLKKQFSIFYWILYLCTLEVLPLFLMWKVIVAQGK